MLLAARTPGQMWLDVRRQPLAVGFGGVHPERVRAAGLAVSIRGLRLTPVR